MKKRKFSRGNSETFYIHMLKHPPVNDDGSRNRGSSINCEFWDGYDNRKTNRQVPTSFAEAAYWAGQDYKKMKNEVK
ncbi:hypothetical protein LCGC14_2004780 [marine sediment metagenome]|uniref:Uncharacterized protein n=1 Tax=marine sediment metagenome TaxID=412755 RepID=A0A0F9F275_9ZZZZ